MRPRCFSGMQRLAKHRALTPRLSARLPRSAATTASLFLQCDGPPPAVEEDFANIGSRCHSAVHQRYARLLRTAPGPLATESASGHRGKNRTNSNCSCGCRLPLELSESQAELQRSHTPKQNKTANPLWKLTCLNPRILIRPVRRRPPCDECSAVLAEVTET